MNKKLIIFTFLLMFGGLVWGQAPATSCASVNASNTITVGGSCGSGTLTDNTLEAGVVSTNPAHIMNSGLTAAYTVALGLTGRVPCKVVGPVTKGQQLVTSDIPGVAQALDSTKYQPGVVIGKAIENYNEPWPACGVIEVVVGRL